MQPKRHIIDRRIEERCLSITMPILHEVVVLHEVLVLSWCQEIGDLAYVNATNGNISYHRFCPRLAVTCGKSIIADIRAKLGIPHTIRLPILQRVHPREPQQSSSQVQTVFHNLLITISRSLRFDSTLQFLREIIVSCPSITCLHKRYRHKHHDRYQHSHPNRHISNYLFHNTSIQKEPIFLSLQYASTHPYQSEGVVQTCFQCHPSSILNI